jgi:membrane protein implicated in regulation of membrane protease activity
MGNLFDVQDGLSAFFLFCTFFGLFFTVISFFLGAGHGFGGHVGHIGHIGHIGHVGHIGHAGGHAAASGQQGSGHSDNSGVSPVNLSTIMIFVTWFGAAGYILHRYTQMWGVLIVGAATAIGFVGGALMYVFLTRFFRRATTPPLHERDYELVGHTATVTSTIYAGGTGEITYTLYGYRRSESARNLNGQPIPRGTEVVILQYEKGVAYVQAVEEILKQELPAAETLKQEWPKEVGSPLERTERLKDQRLTLIVILS